MPSCWVLTEKLLKIKQKHLLVANELKKLKTFDLDYFIGKSHFKEDGNQNYLVFKPIVRYFKVITSTDYISSWKSKGLSAETIKPLSDNSLAPALNYYDDLKVGVKFTGSCLKQLKFTYIHKTIVNIHIVYELGASTSNDNDSILKICLKGAVSLLKNAGVDFVKMY